MVKHPLGEGIMDFLPKGRLAVRFGFVAQLIENTPKLYQIAKDSPTLD